MAVAVAVAVVVVYCDSFSGCAVGLSSNILASGCGRSNKDDGSNELVYVHVGTVHRRCCCAQLATVRQLTSGRWVV